MIKVLVCGGREYKDLPFLSEVLKGLLNEKGDFTIINGAAEGADLLSTKWAQDNKMPCWRFPADWETHGKAAGPMRNKQMLDEGKPDLVIAFPGGKGTANMVKQARERGIEVREIQWLKKETTNENMSFIKDDRIRSKNAPVVTKLDVR